MKQKLHLPQNLSLVLSLAWYSLTPIGPLRAQIIPDATLGTENSIVTPLSPQLDQIDGGAIRANNLFHSFGQFNIDEGAAAYFSNPGGIDNIFSRVTGGDPSHLLGTLGVLGSANLYFLNPNGIIFGPHARLDISGSFFASTADGIVLSDGTQFSASNPEALPLLTVDVRPPVGLVFEGDSSGTILNAGDLAVPRGQNLALIGGTVVNTGNLRASEGNITLMAVPESGRAELSEGDRVARWVTMPAVGSSSPPLTLAELLAGSGLGAELGVTVDSDGEARLTESGVRIRDRAGVSLVAGNVEVAGDVGGTVDLRGDRVGLFGANIDASGANGGGRVFVGGDYRGQDESLNASRTVVSEDSAIRADAVDEGDGGRVIVWAEETAGFYGAIDASGGLDGGDGGFVEVSGKENLIFRGEVDVEAPMGTAGTLLLDPENIVIVNGSGAVDDAQIGDGEILFADGGGGSTFTISEVALENLAGNADIILEATNDITIDDLNDDALGFQRGSGAITFRAGGDFSMDLYDSIEALGPLGQQIQLPGRTITIIAGGDLTVGNINTRGGGVAAPGGSVVLRASGDITTANIDTYADNPPGNSPGNPYNSGNITITSTGGDIDTSAGGLSANASSGNPGNISLEAAGNITTAGISNGIVRIDGGGGSSITLISGGDIDTTRRSTILDSLSGAGKTGIFSLSGQGSPMGVNITLHAVGNVTTGGILSGSYNQTGTITITSDTGDIDTTAGEIDTSANQFGNLTNPITLNADNGNIRVGNINTFSANADGSTIELNAAGNINTSSGTLNAYSDSGNGGTVSLNALGNIITGEINTNGVTSGGNITLDSQSGTIDTTAGTFNVSSGGAGGNILLNAPGNLTVGNMDTSGVTSAGRIDLISDNASIDTRSGTLSASAGIGGTIALEAFGSLTTGEINSSGLIQGGNINFTSGNNIDTSSGTLNASASSSSPFSNAANGGTISLVSLGSLTTGNLDTSGFAVGGTIDLDSTNNIDTTAGTLDASSVEGSGGTVQINAFGGNIAAGEIDTNGLTSGGSITLTSPDSIDTTSGTLNTSSANGSGGTVQITAPNDIVAGAINTSGTLGGGTLNLRSDNGDIALTNQINTSSNAGISGSIELSALNGDISVSNSDIETLNDTGTAGNIDITAKTFTQSQGESSFDLSGEVQSGRLSITVDRFAMSGNVELALTAESGGIPQDLTLTTDELILENGARISVETIGTTQAPNFIADIKKLALLSGAGGGIFFETESDGGAGRLTVTVPKATVEQGAQISNIVRRGDRGGTLIDLPNSQLNLENPGSAISFENRGAGDADGITIQVATGEVILENGATISVSGTGSGSGGTLNIIADSISLNEGARLTAATFSGKGGNIDLQVRDSILLRFDSDIRADAKGTGEGGNIRMNAGGLILAFLPENSDVIATGIEGRGGNIEATAAGIFGFRLYQDVDTLESDFTASSRFGIDGTVTFNIRDSLQVEPLTEELFDRELREGCAAVGGDAEVKYFEIGRGGLPDGPRDLLGNNDAADWVPFEVELEGELNATPIESQPYVLQQRCHAVEL